MTITRNLNSLEVRQLKDQLFHLKPTVVIGDNGLTSEVFQNIDRSLSNHELIKIRANVSNSRDLSVMASEVCAKAEAILIQTMGYIYRKNLLVEE